MNKTKLFLILLAILPAITVFGQAKKPSLMILPSDVWSNENKFMLEFDNQGTKERIPDYKRAFQESMELINVISKINGVMAERGFPLKNAESVLKSLASDAAEDNMTTSKGGSTIAESPVDKLKKTAKADIVIQLTWKVNITGPKKSVTFNLQGLDAYTDKQIATAQGTGTPSTSAEVAVLLEEAVLAHMDNFCASLQKHFDDMFENGREVAINFKKFDSWSGDFHQDFGGKELGEVIIEWMNQNSVKGRNSNQDFEDNFMTFPEVRIPLYDANNTALDTRAFVRNLQKKLEAPPYNLKSKLSMKGLGKATLIIGDK